MVQSIDDVRKRYTAWISLVLVAILAAAVWRLEVEWRGWIGLTWIRYFHWAIPAGVALFLGWVAVYGGIDPRRRRVAFLIVATLLALIIYPLLELSLRAFFVRGPAFMQYQMAYGLTGFPILQQAVFLLYPTIPLTGLGLAWAFGRRPSVVRAILVLGLFMLAEPFATALLKVTNHVGGADPLHAIKSGFIIPFQVIGLGLIFAPLPMWMEFSLVKGPPR